jgi:long-chain fatty acid transport protein
MCVFAFCDISNIDTTINNLYSVRFVQLTLILSLILFFFTAPMVSNGAGLSNFTQGAGPMGVANASVAHPEGLSSIYFNPAHQLEFEGINIAGGFTLLRPVKEFESTITMTTYDSASNTYTPVHLAANYRVSDTLSLAFTVNNSFGLGSEFPDNTIFRYITTESKLTTWDMNPSVAFQVHEQMVLAVGVRAVYTEATLKQMIPLQSFELSDGKQHFDADGTGYGWNIGATYSPTDNWVFGVSYRSAVDIDLSGDVSFELPQNSTSFLTTIFPLTSADSGLDLPGQLFLGVAYKPSLKWVVEAAARFEQYSCYDKLEVSTQLPVAGKTYRTIAKDWADVWGYMFGVSYQTETGYRFSGGYLFEETPVPDETFEPGVSGLDKHTLTIGAAKRFGNITGRISYAYDFYEDRNISNSGTYSVFNGIHSQKNQSLAFTLSWHI